MSDAWRTRLGILLILLGVGGVIVSFGPLQFGDRFSGRVDAEGTVQWGIRVDATSPQDTVSDGEYGAWKVDYEIDGSGHTGVIIGEHFEGQQLTLSAPADGSIYSVLRLGTPTGLKILSWFVLPTSLALVVVGGWWLTRGLRAQDARNREIAHQQLARLYPQMFPSPATGLPSAESTMTDPTIADSMITGQTIAGPLGGAPVNGEADAAWRVGPPPNEQIQPVPPNQQGPQHDGPQHDGPQSREKKPDFFAPYDI